MNNNAYQSYAAASGGGRNVTKLNPNAPRRPQGQPGYGAPRTRPLNVPENIPEDIPEKAPENTPENTPEKEPKRKKRWWIWLIIAALLVAVGVACFFLIPRNKDEAQVVEEVLVYGMDEPTLFENEECAFIIDAVGEKGDYLELDVRCVNKTKDVLAFSWESTCVNGSMFDPLWSVMVQPESTMRSSITFPLDTLDSLNLLPAEQIKFVMRVHNESLYNKLLRESSLYIREVLENTTMDGYKQVKGYEGYLFSQKVSVDKDGRPYYVDEDKNNVYFDELYDRNGERMYPTEEKSPLSFYNDSLGRPYYFNSSTETVYYEGHGFAFYDAENDKNYFYDENGKAAFYGNSGIPEYFGGTVSQELLESPKPDALAKSVGSYLVHKEFTIYPTGKSAGEVTPSQRITTIGETVYWNGEKGNFILLGGEMDPFKGYIVHSFVENKSDNYIYFAWSNVVVNGVSFAPHTITVLRPHSTAYRDIVIPAEGLKENTINTVSEIDFNVYAVGENLSVPLYPIQWKPVISTSIR